MSRVFFDIKIPVLVRVKPDDERMALTILSVYINFGCFPAPGRDIDTWRFSTELSLPPVIETMYGACVFRCRQVFFSPKNLDVIWFIVCMSRSADV
jgi:hypothetical protein